jgi:hypothetical protein
MVDANVMLVSLPALKRFCPTVTWKWSMILAEKK